MKKDDKLILKNENNEEKEFAILVTFDIKEKSYVLYTDYSKDENENINIFSAIYDEDWNIKPVEGKDEIKIIDKYIKDLEEDLKSGMKFV